MSSVKSAVGRKAAKAVVVHSAHGVTSKVRRQPIRATRLLGLGALAGAGIGFAVGRTTAGRPVPPVTTAPPPPVAFPQVQPPPAA